MSLLTLFAGCLLLGQESRTITLKVLDENGQPIAGAKARIYFFMGRDTENHEGETDAQGVFTATGRPIVGTGMSAQKEGRYPVQFDNLNRNCIPEGREVTQTVVLPEKRNPIPLYAKNFSGGTGEATLKFPVQNEWLGYDFEAGDWVAPYGKGKTTDIRFKFRNEFKGWQFSDQEMANSRRINKDKTEDEIRFYYGKWAAELAVSFPGEKEGMIQEKERYQFYCPLKLPHQAPETGYLPTRHYEANNLGMRPVTEEMGFFLRTRVKLDAKGQIISANYTKLYGDISLDPRGSISFWYYFNPTPNDRNLEFNPAKNLFPANTPGAKVSDP